MDLENIREEIEKEGKNPDDFNVDIREGGYSVTPKWFYETKQIAKKEDEKLKNEVDLETAQSSMELINALSTISTQNEINQATMMMELLNMIATLQGGE